MNNDNKKRKFKGGAEKNREKHQKILNTVAQQCHKITNMFSSNTSCKQSVAKNISLQVIREIADGSNIVIDNHSTNNCLESAAKNVSTEVIEENADIANIVMDNNSTNNCLQSVVKNVSLELFEETASGDLLDGSNIIFRNDPVNFVNVEQWTPELKNMILSLGACQPKEQDLSLVSYEKDHLNRSFHSAWYNRKLIDNTYVKREWLSYSPKLNKIFCLYCILYGKNTNTAWTKEGFCHWKNGSLSITKHETSSTHIFASLKVKLKQSCLPILPSILEDHNRQVAFNRELVKQLIEITIFLARHNLPFRGHKENWESDLKGNFKDMVVLISQHSPTLSVHINQLMAKGKKENSFISWDRQNSLIDSIAQYISSVIRTQIVKAGYFSICMDTTFDVSHKEQLSFIARYIFKSKIHERIIAITESPLTTGKVLFDMFKCVMEKCGLNWKKNLVGQSYDGAANMRGSYSGLQARILDENPKALFVWCHAHRLNLIVLSAVGSCIEAVDLFGNMEKLYCFITCSKKRSDIYRMKQKEIYPKKQVHAIKRVGTTRWMSNSFALATIFETLEAILDMLEEVKNQDGSSDYKIATECNGLLMYFQSSRFIVTAFMFKHLFDILGPLSKLFQGRDLDILAAVNYLKKAENNIIMMRNDEVFNDIFEEAKSFSEKHFGDFEINNLRSFRNRKKKVVRQIGEITFDETIENPVQYFKVSVYFLTIDIIIQQIHDKFNQNSVSVMKDIGLLSLKRMKEKTDLPQDAFKMICNVYGLNQELIKNEYIMFKEIVKDLDVNLLLKLPEKIHADSDEDNIHSDDEESDGEIDNYKNMASLINIFETMNNANIKAEFENLYNIIKLSLTLPTSSCTVERSFSKLKIIKTRLRSTMEQTRLENLMLISCEHDINIDIDKVIDIFAGKSSVLTKLLTF